MTDNTQNQQHLQENQDNQQQFQKKDKSEGGQVSGVALAVQHWENVLRDDDATDTAKSNAASGLARLAQDEEQRRAGKIHQMDRRELLAEIARAREALGDLGG